MTKPTETLHGHLFCHYDSRGGAILVITTDHSRAIATCSRYLYADMCNDDPSQFATAAAEDYLGPVVVAVFGDQLPRTECELLASYHGEGYQAGLAAIKGGDLVPDHKVLYLVSWQGQPAHKDWELADWQHWSDETGHSIGNPKAFSADLGEDAFGLQLIWAPKEDR